MIRIRLTVTQSGYIPFFFFNYIAALDLIYRVHLKFEAMHILLISVALVSRVKSYELPEE